jgi:hypothetical protein
MCLPALVRAKKYAKKMEKRRFPPPRVVFTHSSSNIPNCSYLLYSCQVCIIRTQRSCSSA